MSVLEDVAREFATIDRDLAGATGARAGELAIQSLALRHDLNLLCEIPCDCDEGTCPGLITRKSTLQLDCGHYAIARERLRPGEEKWCASCAQWRPLAHPKPGDSGDTPR